MNKNELQYMYSISEARGHVEIALEHLKKALSIRSKVKSSSTQVDEEIGLSACVDGLREIRNTISPTLENWLSSNEMDTLKLACRYMGSLFKGSDFGN